MTEEHRYNLTELLACVAAGLLEDGCSVFVGTGFPIRGRRCWHSAPTRRAC